MNQITILVVEDHPLIRKAWVFMLNQDLRFKVIAECENGETAVELSREMSPDIVIMDIRLRGMSGIEATQLIREFSSDAKIIGLSFHIRPEYVQEMLERGASGYLTKISSPEEIFKAIPEVYGGGTYICSEIKDILSQEFRLRGDQI